MNANHLPAQRRTVDRRVVGSPEYVRSTIQLIQRSGRLVHVSPWQESPEGVQVTVRFLERQEQAAAPTSQRRWPAVATVAGVGVTVLGVGAYALIRLVDAVIAALPVIGGALLVLALVAAFAGGRSRTFSGTFTGRMD